MGFDRDIEIPAYRTAVLREIFSHSAAGRWAGVGCGALGPAGSYWVVERCAHSLAHQDDLNGYSSSCARLRPVTKKQIRAKCRQRLGQKPEEEPELLDRRSYLERLGAPEKACCPKCGTPGSPATSWYTNRARPARWRRRRPPDAPDRKKTAVVPQLDLSSWNRSGFMETWKRKTDQGGKSTGMAHGN